MIEKRKAGRPKDSTESTMLRMRLPWSLHTMIKDFAQSNRLSLTNAVVYLLEIGLKHTQGEK
jgi:hypothetical protein